MYGARLSAQASRLHANSWNNNASQAPQYKYIAAARPVQILYALHTSDHVCRVTVYCLGKELFMWQVLWIIINIGAGGAIGGSLAPSVFEAISKCWVSELGRDADWLITYPESGLDTPGTCHSVAMHSYDRTSDRLPTLVSSLLVTMTTDSTATVVALGTETHSATNYITENSYQSWNSKNIGWLGARKTARAVGLRNGTEARKSLLC